MVRRAGRAVRPALIYGLLGLFFAAERFLRTSGVAASLETSAADRGSTRALRRAFVISALALESAPILDHWCIGSLPRGRVIFRLGVAVMVAGLLLRVWAMHTLGGAYTRTLRTVDEQRLVRTGPYRLVRHPGYLATLLVWLGAAIGLTNALVVAVVSLVMLDAYHARIDAEEEMLAERFGEEYAAYRRRTRRLVPLVY